MTPRLACCLSLGLVACVLLAAPAAAGKETSEQRRERLEIQKLEAETGTVADLRGWATIAAVMFTGGAFAVSVLRFGHEVRDARTLRREERFEANLERLTDFAGSESGMLTRALVALHNLRSLSTGDAEFRERVNGGGHHCREGGDRPLKFAPRAVRAVVRAGVARLPRAPS